MSQLHEIDIQTLNFPAHWVSVENNHEGLASNHIADFGGDKLIDTIKIKKDIYIPNRILCIMSL